VTDESRGLGLHYSKFVSRAATRLVIATVLATPLAAQAQPDCDAPLDMVRLATPLTHVAHKLATKAEPIVIVAIGSSSTQGAGASSPAANYPSRLKEELSATFRGHPIVVYNRGVGGEEIDDMLKRFDEAISVHPDLVLWQLGTNSVLRDHAVAGHDEAIRVGLAKIRAVGADVVLIDPQYSPKVIAKPLTDSMVDLISLTAKAENVDLFRRFQLMKRWVTRDHMKFESFVSPDGLHMNDWSYACMAKGLSVAIAEAAQRPVQSATAAPQLFNDVP